MSQIQMPLWESDAALGNERIVNVAQVPQRSPFRYPGGKTWLVPHIRAWIKSLPEVPIIFVEPFAGGGIISLTVAFEGLAEHVIMVELDKDVCALWETILSDDNEWLAERILAFDLSPETVRDELSVVPVDKRNHGFQTLLRNRTNHGGILAPGSGVLKHGENGKGIRSRWYAQTLAKRIRNIRSVRDRITFIPGDGLEVIRQHASSDRATFFIDPPYTAGKNGKRAGSRLYSHSELDHEELFTLAQSIAGGLLMTYDNAEEVVELATRHGLETLPISMKNTHHAAMTELIIGQNLAWA